MRAITYLFISILVLTSVLAQVPQPITPQEAEAPTPSEIRIIQQVKTESQNTRKFMVDTFNEKSAQFFAEADNRMAYMEQKLDSALDTAVISLAILWGAVTIFFCALFAMFSRLMDRARYKKLESAIRESITKEMNKKVDVTEQGYATIRQVSEADVKAEKERIAALQREAQIRQQEEVIKRQIDQLNQQFNQLRQPQPPMPHQNVPVFNVPPKKRNDLNVGAIAGGAAGAI